MIAAGFFSESLALDITVVATIVGLFATIVGMFISIKQSQRESQETRAKEVEEAVLKVINASPNKVVVDPQPLIVKMEKDFVHRDDFDGLSTRVAALEINRHNDQVTVMKEIAKVPFQVIALLKETKGLII